MGRIALLSIDIPNAGRVIGDPMAVEEDDHPFENDSGFGVFFYVLDVRGKSKADLRHVMNPFLVPALPSDPEFNAPDAADRFVHKGPHRWNLGINDKMPANKRSTLKNDFKLIIPPAATAINPWFTDRYLGHNLIDG